MEFAPMPKMARLSREVVVTEKIDGTNASIFIQPLDDNGAGKLAVLDNEPFLLRAGSRTRWITPEDDNFGFAAWVYRHADELVKLGPGHHFGEWWGVGIQRGYNMSERRFSLFNVGRWISPQWGDPDRTLPDMQTPPICCHVVPVLGKDILGLGNLDVVDMAISRLIARGSAAAPGFMDPEGVVVYHTAANFCFKKTIKGDEAGKSYEGHVKKERPAKPGREPQIMFTGGRRMGKSASAYNGPERRQAK